MPVKTDIPGVIERAWWSHLSEYALLEGGTLTRGQGWTRVLVPVASSFPNTIFDADLGPARLEDRIDEAVRPFSQKGLPFNWWIGPGTRPPDLAARLAEKGFEKSIVLKGMHRPLAGWPQDRPPLDGLTFREVADEETLTRRVELMGRAYGIEPAFWPGLKGMYSRLGHGPGAKWRHLAGYLEGRMVTAASLQLLPRVAVLHNVGTEPSLQGQGLATAATMAVLGLALDLGREEIVLQATGAGARLYRGLGFLEYGDLTAFTLAGPGGGGVWREPAPDQGEDRT